MESSRKKPSVKKLSMPQKRRPAQSELTISKTEPPITKARPTTYIVGLAFVIGGSVFEIVNSLWAGRRFWGMLSFFTLGFFLLLSIHPLATIIGDATLPNGIPYTLAADQELMGAWVTAIFFGIFAGSGAALSSVVGRIRQPRAPAATNGSGYAVTNGD